MHVRRTCLLLLVATSSALGFMAGPAAMHGRRAATTSQVRRLASGAGFGPPGKDHHQQPRPHIQIASGIEAYARGKPLIEGPTMDDVARTVAAPPGKVFENLAFPTAFTFKIIGKNEPSFKADCLEKIAKILSVEPSAIAHSAKETDNKKFVSITCSPVFYSSAQIYKAYEVLSAEADPRIKFVL